MTTPRQNVHEAVQAQYGAIAEARGGQIGCCGPAACGCADPVTSNLYSLMRSAASPPTRAARALLEGTGLDVEALAPELDGRLASAFIRAHKPEAAGCCGPECCA